VLLIRVVRKGRMSPEMSWRREEGIGSREQVVVCVLDATSRLTSSEERGEAGKADREGCRVREDSSRGERGGDVLQRLCKVGYSEGGGGEGGLRRDENIEKSFLWLEAEE